MGYIRVPLETSPTLLWQEVFDSITAQAPTWLPQDASLDVWIIKAFASIAAENRDIASDVQDDIFRWFGANMVGVQPVDATSAYGTTTWTMNDTAGHVIPSGTAIGITNQSGNMVAFVVVNDVTVPPGNSATAAGEVIVSAVEPGSAGTTLGGAGVAATLIDVLDWVQSITLTAPTTGGTDAETDESYLNRLAFKLQGLSQRPILPNDFARMAVDASPEVARVVAIDGYNPAGGTYNNERMVAVAAVNANGQPVSSVAKAAIDSYLQANREINFVVNVIDPTYTTINVVTTVVNATGFTNAVVDTNVTAALHAMLDSANWGRDPTLLDETAGQTWLESTKVYYNEVIAAISNAEGVSRLTALTLNGGTADITLTSPAALTQLGTITINHA